MISMCPEYLFIIAATTYRSSSLPCRYINPFQGFLSKYDICESCCGGRKLDRSPGGGLPPLVCYLVVLNGSLRLSPYHQLYIISNMIDFADAIGPSQLSFKAWSPGPPHHKLFDYRRLLIACEDCLLLSLGHFESGLGVELTSRIPIRNAKDKGLPPQPSALHRITCLLGGLHAVSPS